MKLRRYIFKSVKSTNDIAIHKIRDGITSGIVIARKQTEGRGRYGNKWIYMKNNLFMSIFFNFNSNISIKTLTLLSCKIVQQSLLKFLRMKIEIKKPNDLLINKKKVCGILQETMFYNDNKFAIIGIGINIDRSPEINNYPTTYINFFTKKKITTFKVYNEIKKNFEKFLKNLK